MSCKVPIAPSGDQGPITCSPGYDVSQRIRKRVEEAFGYCLPGPPLRYDFLNMRLAVSRKSLRVGCYDALTSALYASTQNLDTLRLRTLD
jgi:hypothetical protein